MSLTREAIFAAATALLERGEKVSVRTVRQALGGGSPNEIAPLVKEWKAQQTAQQQEIEQLTDLPPSVREALTPPIEQLLARLWAILRDLTTTELENLRKDYMTERQALREEADEQAGLAQDLAAELDKAQHTLAEEHQQRQAVQEANVTLRAQADLLQGQLQELRAQLTASEAARATATTQTHSLEAQVAQLSERLQEEQTRRQHLAGALEQAQQAAEAARAEAVAAVNQRDQTAAGMREAHHRMQALESEQQRRTQEIQSLHTQVARLEAQYQAADAARSQTERHAEQLAVVLQTLQSSLKDRPPIENAPGSTTAQKQPTTALKSRRTAKPARSKPL